MPLNQPKNYSFLPNPVGGVRLVTRSSRRSRLWAGGSFWRSHERGESANAIQITCVEDLSGEPEGLLVVHHTVLNADEQVSATGMALPDVKLFSLNLLWDEEIRIFKEGESLVARKYGIRWQIGGGETVRADLGRVFQNRLVSAPGVSFKVDANAGTWPSGAVLYLRPRTHRYALVVTSITDPTTLASTTGWDIQELRATLNESDTWVRMPNRPQGSGGGEFFPGPITGGEDGMDDGSDDQFLTAFDTKNMTGGDGLPGNPVGFNTGPDRVLIHLNYSERDNGSLGEVNQVFEWVGDSAAHGSWQRYA